jgi:hypothetical protein
MVIASAGSLSGDVDSAAGVAGPSCGNETKKKQTARTDAQNATMYRKADRK